MPYRRIMASDDYLIKLYTQDHLTYQEIANKFEVSRAAIHKRLKKLGIKRNPPKIKSPSKDMKERDVEIIKLYTENHLTFQEIGDRFNLTRSAIGRRLKINHVKITEGTWVETKCTFCKKSFKIIRSRWKRFNNVYCSNSCYMKTIENPNYIPNRHSQRKARKIVSLFYDLQSINIVHHHDTNSENNDPRNLAVFPTQADHMRFHRGGPCNLLWDGRELTDQDIEKHRETINRLAASHIMPKPLEIIEESFKAPNR